MIEHVIHNCNYASVSMKVTKFLSASDCSHGKNLVVYVIHSSGVQKSMLCAAKQLFHIMLENKLIIFVTNNVSFIGIYW